MLEFPKSWSYRLLHLAFFLSHSLRFTARYCRGPWVQYEAANAINEILPNV
jgi:hypothetical protein